jgi:hypothetical protein
MVGSDNPTSHVHTGSMRLVFTANRIGSVSEVGIFFVDYQIDSVLTYQIKTINPATIAEFPTPLPSDQSSSIAGFVIFKTLDTSDQTISDFFTALAPPVDVTPGSHQHNDYEITDTVAGGTEITGDFAIASMSHGSGILVSSAYNVIPPIGTDELSVLAAINYPWRKDAILISNDGYTTIPSGLFSEFTMTVPMGNRSGTSEENFPVYLSRIRRLDSSANSIQLFFTTYDTILGSTNDELIEFASLILNRSDIGSGGNGKVIEIVPFNNLRNNDIAEAELFSQNFGSGHVVLSSNWEIDSFIVDFFDSFLSIVDDPADRIFESRLGDFALHCSPMNIPTLGEDAALSGSTSRRAEPEYPSDDNRFVCENDQGLGDEVDFDTLTDFVPNDSIDSKAYKGSLLSKSVVLLVDSSNVGNFNYEEDILPRLTFLLGRLPIHSDIWFDGVTFKRYDGISKAWIG